MRSARTHATRGMHLQLSVIACAPRRLAMSTAPSIIARPKPVPRVVASTTTSSNRQARAPNPLLGGKDSNSRVTQPTGGAVCGACRGLRTEPRRGNVWWGVEVGMGEVCGSVEMRGVLRVRCGCLRTRRCR